VAQKPNNSNAVAKVTRIEPLESRVLYAADAAPLLALIDPFDEHTLNDQPPEKALWKSVDDQSETRYLATFENSSTNQITEVVIVDSTSPDTLALQTLLQSQLDDGDRIAIVTLGATFDPLASIAEILSRYEDLQAVHIVSHASDGALQFGNQVIDQSTLLASIDVLQQWGESLQIDGDILLYGCNLSATDDGRAFAKTLSTLTDADVASSNDITGHALKNGDWDLEVVEGEIETQVIAQAQVQDDWTGSLDITSNLIHHWKLDGNGDDSAGSANATLINGVGSPTGLLDQAGDFSEEDGSPTKFGEVGAYLVDPLAGSDFTISFWMHVNTAADGAFLFGNQQSGSTGYGLSLNATGNVVFEISDGTVSNRVTSTDIVTDSDWRLVTARRAGGVIVLDVYNRATDTNSSITGPAMQGTISVGNSFPTRIGTQTPTVGDYDGLIDNIRIYERALLNDDINELISQVTGGVEQVLVNNVRTTVVAGGPAVPITSSILLTTDADTPDSNLVYTIIGASTAASFVFDGNLIGANDTFTQENINLGQISVVSLDDPVATAASILFTVDDGQGTVSSDSFEFDIDHTPVINESPTITDSTLPSFNEDSAPVLTTIQDSIGPQFSDANPGDTLSVIAVIANPPTFEGEWSYSADGTNWHFVSSVSPSNALVISSTYYIKFWPATNYNGSPPALEFHVFDSTYTGATTNGAAKVFDDTTAIVLGGPQSIDSASADVTVVAVNDRPDLIDTTMSSFDEDTTPAPETITDIFSANFTDVDTGDELSAIAVIVNSITAAGNWSYSADGTSWLSVGAVDTSNALVLPAAHYLKFLPNENYNGTPPILEVVAIDSSFTGAMTNGALRETLNISSFGTGSPLSSVSTFLDVSVLPVNDLPYNVDNNQSALNVDEDAVAGTHVGYITALDVDSSNLTFHLSTNAGGRIAVDSVTGEVTVAPGASLDYETNTFHQITMHVYDSSGIIVEAKFPIHVWDVNDAPSLTNASLADVLEDTVSPAGERIVDVLVSAFTDVDAGDSLQAVAIVGNTATNGDWRYKYGSGGWVSVGSVSSANALLVSSASKLQFVPNAGYFGPADPLTVFALDSTFSGTVSQSGTSVYTSSLVADAGTSLSDTSANITVQVIPVNDAASVALTNMLVSLPEDTLTGVAIDVADIIVTDIDAGTNTLSLSGTHAAWFQITGSKLQLQSGVSLDADTLGQLEVNVGVDDTSVPGTPDDSVAYLLQISDVNEPPELSAIESSAINFIENGTATPLSSTIVVAEPDNGLINSANVLFSAGYAAGEDALLFTAQNAIAGSFNASTGLLSLTGQASALEYQTAIRSIEFQNNSNAPTTDVRKIVINVQDDLYSSNIVTRDINVIAVNNAPTVQLIAPVSVVVENSADAQAVDIAGIAVSDVDGGTNTLSLSGADAAFFEIVSGRLQIKAGVPIDREAMSALDVTVNVDDTTIGTAVDDSALLSILVSNVDEPPVLSATESSTINFTENGPSVAVTSTILVAEPDNGIIDSASLKISTGYVIGEDTLNFSVQNGIAGSFNPATGVLGLSGQASAADYQAAIRSITYNNLSDNPAVGTRVIDIQVNDGANVSNIESRTLNIAASNDAPSIQLTPIATSIAENSVITQALDVADVVVTDVDAGTNVLSLSGVHAGLFQIVSDRLQLKSGVMLDSETLAQLDVTVSVDDASIGIGVEDSVSYTLNVDDVNETPVLNMVETSAIGFVENGVPVPISSMLTVLEPDNGFIYSASIQFSSGYVSDEDMLEFVSQNGIVGSFDIVTGSLELTGQATATDYQSAIRSITYSNLDENPSIVSRTLDISVSDGVNLSNVESRALNVIDQNDAPTVQLNTQITSIEENSVI